MHSREVEVGCETGRCVVVGVGAGAVDVVEGQAASRRVVIQVVKDGVLRCAGKIAPGSCAIDLEGYLRSCGSSLWKITEIVVKFGAEICGHCVATVVAVLGVAGNADFAFGWIDDLRFNSFEAAVLICLLEYSEYIFWAVRVSFFS